MLLNTFTLPYSPDQLDLAKCVTSGQVFRWSEVSPGVWRGKDGEHWYMATLAADQIQVTSNATEHEFRQLFRLDEPLDLGPTLRALAPEWAGPTQRLAGFRLLRPSDPVEALFCFLCTSNNHLSRIKSMCQTLAQYGRPMAQMPGWTPMRFPAVERLASLEEGELRAQGFGYRAKTLPQAARQVAERGGLEWLLGLKQQPYSVVHHELAQLSGVGPKLADCIALYALHHTSAVPVDTHLWQAASALWFPSWENKSLTAPRYRQIGEAFRERFGGYAAHAHLFLYYDHMRQGRQRSKPSQ